MWLKPQFLKIVIKILHKNRPKSQLGSKLTNLCPWTQKTFGRKKTLVSRKKTMGPLRIT